MGGGVITGIIRGNIHELENFGFDANFTYNRGTFTGTTDGHGRISCSLYNKQVDPPREFRIGVSNGEQGNRRGFLSDGYSDGRDPFGWLSGGTKNFTVDGQTFSLYELSALNSSRNILEIKGNGRFNQLIIRLSDQEWLFNLPNGYYGSTADTVGFWNFMNSHIDQTVQITIRTP